MAQHLLGAPGGRATSRASEDGPVKLKERGERVKGERAEEGGRREGLALEQIPAHQEHTEA